jgi:hypothetical protein
METYSKYESNNDSSENSDNIENKQNKTYQKILNLYKTQSDRIKKNTCVDYLYGNQEDEHLQDDPFNYKKLFFSDFKENYINDFLDSYKNKTYHIKKIKQTNEELNKIFENKISKINKTLLNNEENLIKLSNQIETNKKLENLNNLQSEFLVDDYLNQLKPPKIMKEKFKEFTFSSKNNLEKSLIPHRFDNILIKNYDFDYQNNNNNSNANAINNNDKDNNNLNDFNNYEIIRNEIILIIDKEENEEEKENINDNNKINKSNIKDLYNNNINKQNLILNIFNNNNKRNSIINPYNRKSIYTYRHSNIDKKDLLNLWIFKEFKKINEKKNRKIEEDGIISIDPRFNIDIKKINLKIRETLKNKDEINYLKFINYCNNKVIFLEAIELNKNDDLENEMELYKFLSPINIKSLQKRSQILIESKLKPLEHVLKKLFKILTKIKKNILEKKVIDQKKNRKSQLQTIKIKSKYDYANNHITEGSEDEKDSIANESIKNVDGNTEKTFDENNDSIKKENDFSFDKFSTKGNYNYNHNKNESNIYKNYISKKSTSSIEKINSNNNNNYNNYDKEKNEEFNKDVIDGYKKKLKNYFCMKKNNENENSSSYRENNIDKDINKYKENSKNEDNYNNSLGKKNSFNNSKIGNLFNKSSNNIDNTINLNDISSFRIDEKIRSNKNIDDVVNFIPKNLNVNSLKNFISSELNRQNKK